MRNILGTFTGSRSIGEAGFTLIEMLIVVGIIVALAAAIVPQVVSFSGKGEEGKKETEKASVQTAIETMFAEGGITAVTASTAGTTGNKAWNADIFAGEQPVTATEKPLNPECLPVTSTDYAYCWNSRGTITLQIADGSTDTCP